MPHVRRGRWWLRFLLLAGMAAAAPRAADAGTGEVINTPARGVVNRSGFTLQIDPQWVEGSGYRNVRVHLKTVGGPAPSDRTIQVKLYPNSWRASQSPLEVSGQIELKQGQTTATETILVQAGSNMQALRVEVVEGGKVLREHSSYEPFNQSANLGYVTEIVPSILVIDPAAPTLLDRPQKLAGAASRRALAAENNLRDVGTLAALTRRHYADSSIQRSDEQILRDVSNSPMFELFPPSDLPESWLGLTTFDLIILSLDDLKQLEKKHQSRHEALRRWVAAGGSLLVLDAGNAYQRLDELHETLDLPEIDPDSGDRPGWRAANTALFNESAISEISSSTYSNWEEPAWDFQGNGVTRANVRNAFGTETGPKFLIRDYGYGLVLAMSADDPFPGDPVEWCWILNSLGEARWQWYRRHGLSMSEPNEGFWNFTVPGTGKAPVWGFGVLMTLFALVIGPVNYFVLQRWKRLYLLLATIPLCAGLVILGLFAYAIVTDGLGTRVRVRSYTHIDQGSGRTVSWSRQAYYAGLAPSRGLEYPEDAAVYPIDQYPQGGYGGPEPPPRVTRWDDGQNLRSGYIQSRVTSQALVVTSNETQLGISVSRPSGGGEPTATNRLGVPIEYLLVKDKQDKLWVAESIEVDGQSTLTEPESSAHAVQPINLAIINNRPEPPPGMDAGAWNQRNWNRRMWGRSSGYSGASMNTSLLEQRIASWQSGRTHNIKPGSYIAITSSAPDTPKGVDHACEEAGFHLVEGEF